MPWCSLFVLFCLRVTLIQEPADGLNIKAWRCRGHGPHKLGIRPRSLISGILAASLRRRWNCSEGIRLLVLHQPPVLRLLGPCFRNYLPLLASQAASILRCVALLVTGPRTSPAPDLRLATQPWVLGVCEDPACQEQKQPHLVLISKLPKNEDQKAVGVFCKMLARLKCAGSFAKRKALTHSVVYLFTHAFIQETMI